jgi:propanediol dehydratase small subunit
MNTFLNDDVAFGAANIASDAGRYNLALPFRRTVHCVVGAQITATAIKG